MKRILFMHQASTIGGGSYCLLNILREIDKSNIEPIACLASDGPLRMEIEKLGIEVVIFTQMAAIPYNRSLWSYSSARAYWRVKQSISSFKQLLNDKNIDVVYLNNMMIYKYLKPAKECGCKTVLHCREHWPLDEHLMQLQWARNAVYKYADELIAINNYSASIFPKKKATIVYDWIDMDSRYEKRPMDDIFGEDTSNLKIYLFTGGMQPIKGTFEILSTFVYKLKDPDSRLLCIGLNPDIETLNLRGKIKKILASLGYLTYNWKVYRLVHSDKRITCIPSTYMITHIMQQCYCNLSYFTIPHANLTMVEAGIECLPTIAAKNEESLDYSFGGKYACLFNPSDINDFYEAIKTLDEQYEKYKNLLKTGAPILAKRFSRQVNVKRLNTIIDKI